MSNYIDISMIGSKKLQRKLEKLDIALQKKIVRQSINRAMLPVRERAKQYVPIDTGNLRDSIKRISRTRRGKAAARIITGGRAELGIPAESRGYYPAVIEYGTRSPARPAKSFMRRAMTELKESTLKKTGDYIDLYIRRQIKK